VILNKHWAERFGAQCAKLRSARKRSLADGESVYLAVPPGRSYLVTTGYIKLFDAGANDHRIVRLLVGRGGLFGDRPFRESAFQGFLSPQAEHAVAHGRVELLQLDRKELEAAVRTQTELSVLMAEAMSARAEFLERRLLWQFTSPVRARMAATLRDLVCFDGNRCEHGYTIDVRLTHQDLAELVGAARPVVSAELSRMREEGLIRYDRSYLCVDDLVRLDRIALG
jgi:CRP-like cAMP-binding protein